MPQEIKRHTTLHWQNRGCDKQGSAVILFDSVSLTWADRIGIPLLRQCLYVSYNAKPAL